MEDKEFQREYNQAFSRGFTQFVADELRATSARNRIGQIEISEWIDRSQSYVSKRMAGKADFEVAEFLLVCLLIGADSERVISAAVLAGSEFAGKTVDEGKPATVSPAQDDYSLAADSGYEQTPPEDGQGHEG